MNAPHYYVYMQIGCLFLHQRIFERLQVRQGMLRGSYRLCLYCSLEVAKDTLNYHIAWQESSDTTIKNQLFVDWLRDYFLMYRYGWLYIAVGEFVYLPGAGMYVSTAMRKQGPLITTMYCLTSLRTIKPTPKQLHTVRTTNGTSWTHLPHLRYTWSVYFLRGRNKISSQLQWILTF